MPEKHPSQLKSISPDWLVRGVLTKIGDIFDRLTGRGWKPSSSLATSELIERLKALLDAEAENTEGRGFFVPHNIQLKMQWDKFSADSDISLQKLENELLTAAVDHINDRRYYTYQPLIVEVRPDYFTSGVKLFVSFERIVDEGDAAAMNVIVPGGNTAEITAAEETKTAAAPEEFVLRFKENGKPKVQTVEFIENVRKSVGRTKENNIAIDDASVSKHHASLVLNSAGSLLLADTGSTNGTFINARRIAYGKAEPLKEGDRVNFGTVEVTFERIARPAAEEPVPSTQADTVSINGLEFRSKPSVAAPTETIPSQVQMDKTIDSLQVERRSDELPLEKTIASSEIVPMSLTDVQPKPTENRIDFDFSDKKEKEPEK